MIRAKRARTSPLPIISYNHSEFSEQKSKWVVTSGYSNHKSQDSQSDSVLQRQYSYASSNSVNSLLDSYESSQRFPYGDDISVKKENDSIIELKEKLNTLTTVYDFVLKHNKVLQDTSNYLIDKNNMLTYRLRELELQLQLVDSWIVDQ